MLKGIKQNENLNKWWTPWWCHIHNECNNNNNNNNKGYGNIKKGNQIISYATITTTTAISTLAMTKQSIFKIKTKNKKKKRKQKTKKNWRLENKTAINNCL